MLFNSYPFLFFFFPLVLGGFFLIARSHARAAIAFLGLASLFFYGWWSIKALPLLVASICFNFWMGAHLTPESGRSTPARRRLLIAALGVNLGVLAIFKYANFFMSNVDAAFASAGFSPVGMAQIVLPIGISFYTFTQIAFLVDCWAGKVREREFGPYLLFVTYFPHLIAGPVLHHAQMMPQFADAATYRPQGRKIAIGITIFVIGLSKKILVADRLGLYADMVFNGVHGGAAPSLHSAWMGAIAYSLQIYFDFSGYSDMAVGISLCFGIHLPQNFFSPYKSTSIIEFWRRWHISLSTFLRDYLYVPLGGNRKGPGRRYLNLFATMLLGGLWHGAGWTFVIWGAMHGAFLTVNHLWKTKLGARLPVSRIYRVFGWSLTVLCVIVAWVVFRAENIDDALVIYKGMLGLNGTGSSSFSEFSIPYEKSRFYKMVLGAILICVALPPAISVARWVPSPAALMNRPVLTNLFALSSALVVFALLWRCVSKFGSYSPFIYFQF